MLVSTKHSGRTEDLQNVLGKNLKMAESSHDWKPKGCGICHYPRSEHQIKKRKDRLCTSIITFLYLHLN